MTQAAIFTGKLGFKTKIDDKTKTIEISRKAGEEPAQEDLDSLSAVFNAFFDKLPEMDAAE